MIYVSSFKLIFFFFSDVKPFHTATVDVWRKVAYNENKANSGVNKQEERNC